MLATNWLPAAYPCPPPSPPVFDPPDCPAPAALVNGTIFPSCYLNHCGTWGAVKAYDSRTLGMTTLAHSGLASVGSPLYFQFDLGLNPPNITAVRITARGDGWLEQSQNLNVYLSANASFANTRNLCQADVRFNNLGDTQVIPCPIGLASRFVSAMQMRPLAMTQGANGWCAGPPSICPQWAHASIDILNCMAFE